MPRAVQGLGMANDVYLSSIMGNYDSGKTADLCLEWLRSGGKASETAWGQRLGCEVRLVLGYFIKEALVFPEKSQQHHVEARVLGIASGQRQVL